MGGDDANGTRFGPTGADRGEPETEGASRSGAGDEPDRALPAPAPSFAEGSLDGAEVVDLVPVLSRQAKRPAPPVDTRLLDDLPLPVLVQDRTGLLHANPPFLKLTGYPSLAALEGAGGVSALFDDAPGTADAGDDPVPMRLKRADGSRRPVAAAMQSVPWRGGATRKGSSSITGGSGRALLLTLRPLDDRGRPLPGVPPAVVPGAVEDRLASLNAVLDEATDGVVFLDEDRRIRSLSRSAEALFGHSDEDVRGRSFAVLFAPDSQARAVDLVDSLGGEGPRRRSGIELDALTADDREVPLFVTIGAMRDDGGYCAVLRDVSEWRDREGSLRDATEAAEETSRRKSRFLARVSHEIRTPLNAIIGFAEVMAEERLGPVGNPKYREYLADIRSSGRHVLDLVNDLLDIARIEAGREDLRFEAVELPDIAREALALVSPQAADGRILVRTDMHDVPPVVADRRSLKQVMLNVLANAVNYTAPGGQVIVSIRSVDGGVTVRIRDTGVGMDESDIARALEPFGDPPARIGTGDDEAAHSPPPRVGRRGNGAGLGLPLSKAMAEANRARFAISSVRGRGTLVELHFPRERVLD